MKLLGNMKVENNELTIGKVKTTELADRFGTPLYIMDEALIRSNCRRYCDSFRCNEGKNRVAYAGKAFLTLYMCRIIEECSMYLDVVSAGELFTAHKAEFPMNRVLFHGNNKTLDEIEMGVKYGVGTFVVDNFYEIENLNEIAKRYNVKQRIYLRVAPGIEAHTHDYIKTGQIDSKFGFTPEKEVLLDIINKAEDMSNIELAGLHCHIGSQIFDTEPYMDAAKIMLTLIKKIKDHTGYEIKELDLGGGFGIYYTEGDTPKSIEEYTTVILKTVDDFCRENDMNIPVLTIEPGRSIVGNAGTTLYTAGSIKDIPNIRKYVSVDGGMSDNIRPSLYKAKYECAVANNVISDDNEVVTLAGKCCESGDILVDSIELPSIKSGDLIAITTTGAYGYSMSSNYNKNPRPAVVMVENGQSKLICRRETYEEIIQNEIM